MYVSKDEYSVAISRDEWDWDLLILANCSLNGARGSYFAVNLLIAKSAFLYLNDNL